MKKMIAIVLSLLVIFCAAISVSAFDRDASALSGSVTVIADGTSYSMNQGDEFEYEFFLNTGGRVGSLSAVTYYDTAGLDILLDIMEPQETSPVLETAYVPEAQEPGIKPTEKLPEYDYAWCFPRLTEEASVSVVANCYEDGEVSFNFTANNGVAFRSSPINNEENLLIRARFIVTASQGVYRIHTDPLVIADDDENKILFHGEATGAFTTAGRINDVFIPEVTDSYLLGDADSDNQITVLDATSIQKYLAVLPVPEGFSERNGNISGSAHLDILDATYIQKYLALIEIPYPVGQIVYVY